MLPPVLLVLTVSLLLEFVNSQPIFVHHGLPLMVVNALLAQLLTLKLLMELLLLVLAHHLINYTEKVIHASLMEANQLLLLIVEELKKDSSMKLTNVKSVPTTVSHAQLLLLINVENVLLELKLPELPELMLLVNQLLLEPPN